MEKYIKTVRPLDGYGELKDECEIRVTTNSSVPRCLMRAAKLFEELSKPTITVSGRSGAITKAETVAEEIKRRFKGLHSIKKMGTTKLLVEFDPIEEGLDVITEEQECATVHITLSKEPLDTTEEGYSPPIDESLVREYNPKDFAEFKDYAEGDEEGDSKGASSSSKGNGKQKSWTARGKGNTANYYQQQSNYKSTGKGKYDQGAFSSKGPSKGKGKHTSNYSSYGSYGQSAQGTSKGKGNYGQDASTSKGKGKSNYQSAGKGKGTYTSNYDYSDWPSSWSSSWW